MTKPAAAAPSQTTSPAEIDSWAQAVCNSTEGPKYRAPVLAVEARRTPLPSATSQAFLCTNYYPYELWVDGNGADYNVSITIAGYLSPDAANLDIKRFDRRNFEVFGYAVKKDEANAWWIVCAEAHLAKSEVLPPQVPGRAMNLLKKLSQFGFSIKTLD